MTIIQTEKLSKGFKTSQGDVVHAVQDVTLSVEHGAIFGFLGPNGAGKSTTMHILTTLLAPSGGSAQIAGYDLLKEAAQIRQQIGFVSQLGGLKESATGREQLLLYAQLHGFNRKDAIKRITELSDALELSHFMNRPISTYSGGQKRRIDLATGIVHKPKLLFLDEPTTALDPQSRARLWNEVEKLRDQGTTVFLTTHYMDEADALCDRVAIMDHGQIIAEDTPAGLKRHMSSDAITIETEPHLVTTTSESLSHLPFVHTIHPEDTRLHVYVDGGDRVLPEILSTVEVVHSVTMTRPTLDDVFLHLTGRSLRESTN
ncbi:MAG: ATP-binding cassette domain-containing protein [Chloroflexota bacterium]